MKSLTIRQPWASLIALGVKTIETRVWRTRYRGRLAIHAAAYGPSVTAWGADGTRTRLGDYDVMRHQTGLWLFGNGWSGGRDLPLGAVVATCQLLDVVPIVERIPPQSEWHDPWSVVVRGGDRMLHHDWWPGFGSSKGRWIGEQLPYGDFTPGRFAWLLDDVTPVDPPAPAAGTRGLWEWT